VLWERERDELRKTTKKKANRKRKTAVDEKLEKFRQSAFHEKLDHAEEDEEWNDPSLDRRVVHHPPRSRPKAKSYPADQDQVGVSLELGEFADVQTLTVSEAALIVNAIHANRKKYGITVWYTNLVPQ
jgi:hypothetical protein